LAPLNAQIGQIRGRLEELESELRAAEAELETFSADRLRFDALREACSLLGRLDELQAGHLFWGEAPGFEDPAGHLARVRDRIVRFDDRIGGVLEKQADLKAQANRCVDELDSLYEDVQNAHSRDERREEEFAVVRELSPVPYNPGTLPWSHFDESDERYRRTLRTTMLLSLLLAVIIRLVHVPVPVRPVVAPIPERLAMMVRQEPKKPEPVKKAKEERKETKKEAKAEGKKEEKTQQAKAEDKAAPERPKSAPTAQAAAPKRSETAGVLAFKESFRDLMDETAVARLGTEARLSSTAAQANGQAAASRSLVSIAGSGRGGGGNGAVSRNVGSGGIGTAALGRSVGGGGGNEARLGRGGAGLAQVKSTIAAAGVKEAKPLSGGGRPARTDEEIQILFDRYKAALYRIYNTELRKDPSLRGKMVLRITIEPGGAVSACAVESTNMNAQGFSDQIVERVKKFNFGPKDGVPKTTILYPIDFLPAR
jgi:hypothetical protein